MQIKFWAIRVVLGIVLGFAAFAIVEALFLVFVMLMFGGLDEYLNRKHPREEAWLHIFGLIMMMASAPAAFGASFLGVMSAPVRYSDRLVIRSWMMSAALGAITGGCVGGPISLLHPRYLTLDLTVILVAVVGLLVGAIAAIILRTFVNR